jgi:hypothetical protein
MHKQDTDTGLYPFQYCWGGVVGWLHFRSSRSAAELMASLGVQTSKRFDLSC